MAAFLLPAARILLLLQAPQATVAGTVRDAASGEPLAGATVALTDLSRATATDAGGRYRLADVPAGPQHIAVRFIGHAGRTLHALVPETGQLEINVSLRPEPFRLPTLEVRPPVAVRGLEDDTATSSDRSISIYAVRSHPLLAEPDVLQALGGGEVALDPESPSGVHVRGGASDQTAYLLDGVPVFSPYHAAGVFSAWNPDALAGLTLSSSAPSPLYPSSLSGTVAGATRAPGSRLRAQGGVSTTQARLTVDGPLGKGGIGYLVSLRSSFPGLAPRKHEVTYLGGETGDRMAKLEAPLWGGRARLLGYESENEIGAAAAAEGDGAAQAAGRNTFEWHSRSLGAGWSREFGGTAVRVLGWSADGDAGSVWAARPGSVRLTAARRDRGVVAAVEHRSGGTSAVLGIRVERSRTSYRVDSLAGAAQPARLSARTPVTAAFARLTRPVGRRVELEAGASVEAARGVRVAPTAQVRWRSSAWLALSGGYVRAYQFAQSLRNPESVVGTVFPADLYLGAGAPGMPVARVDQVIAAADLRPRAGLRLGIQAYVRRLGGLVLVAPRDGEPFSTGGFAVGSGTSRGLSADLAVSAARYGLVASYGLQRVRLAAGSADYVPEHAATHRLDGGIVVFPTATTLVRLGATAAFGRRGTAVAGGVEYESCNLLDQGCEFAGSPRQGGEGVGATALPAYSRVDLGVRKHWHLTLGGRDAVVALYGTLTNLFNRKNVLAYTKNPSTGEPVGLEMRPLAPLVVGLDWQF